MRRARLIDTFWDHVDVRGPDECWEWTRGRDPDGYGSCYDGRNRGCHRVAWEKHHGQSIPTEMVVRHTCDNPPCCNPAHLLLGTVGDNNRDRDERGRTSAAYGELCGNASLTADDVRKIRALRAKGVSCREIGRRFGVHNAQISRIATGKRWAHVAEDIA